MALYELHPPSLSHVLSRNFDSRLCNLPRALPVTFPAHIVSVKPNSPSGLKSHGAEKPGNMMAGRMRHHS